MKSKIYLPDGILLDKEAVRIVVETHHLEDLPQVKADKPVRFGNSMYQSGCDHESSRYPLY